ncbi:hypothetical protein QN385_25960, partial [Pseudomonas sp. CCI2.4]
AVGDAVVVSAQADEVVEVGGAAVFPVVDVVQVAPRHGGVAAVEGAAAVAYGCGASLVVGGEAFVASHGERDGVVVDV